MKDHKVVPIKFTREEFSRVDNYCTIKGASRNSTIKKIIFAQIDKPKEGRSKKTKNFMFDTNVFDKILGGQIPISEIQRSIDLGYKYFITHIQTDELSNIPDNKKEKRAKLILFLSIVAPSLIPTESFVLGYTRSGFGKKGTAGYYEKLLNDKKTNVKDAIIAETAIKNGFTIITEDKHFIKKIKSLGGLVVDSKEFISSLEKKK